MKWLRTQRSPKRVLCFFQSILLAAVLCGCVICVPFVEATKGRSEFDTDKDYIAFPGNIPAFQHFTTPQMEPGGKGTLNFTITNRYGSDVMDGMDTDDDDKISKEEHEAWKEKVDMRNVRLQLEIYHEARIDESKNLSEIGEPPYFLSSGNTTLVLTFGIIEPGAVVEVRETIKSRIDTREGTYFVRTALSFRYNSTTYSMKSRGHFSKELWEKATSEGDEHKDTGAINLTTLGVDGIIPETTFGVRKAVAIWPIYLFAGLTIFFAGLAIFVYLLEEEVYPNLNKRVEEHRRKLNELWFSLKHRKGKT